MFPQGAPGGAKPPGVVRVTGLTVDGGLRTSRRSWTECLVIDPQVLSATRGRGRGRARAPSADHRHLPQGPLRRSSSQPAAPYRRLAEFHKEEYLSMDLIGIGSADLAEWMKDKPLSILQLDPADRAVLKIAGRYYHSEG